MLFWVGLLLLLYTHLGYPAFMFCLGRRGCRRKAQTLSAGMPTATVVAVSPSNALCIATLGDNRIWSYDLGTQELKLLAGSGALDVIDTKTWKSVKTITTPGPGFFLRSHEKTPYAWTDNFMSPAKDTLQIIDKETLQVVRTLRPSPGRMASHVEFSRDGRLALVSIAEQDGELVVIDSETFAEVKRLPMRKPSGKYNVYNGISRFAGTRR